MFGVLSQPLVVFFINCMLEDNVFSPLQGPPPLCGLLSLL